MARELGDKLGPRLSRLVTSHTLATRLSLAPIEAKISAAAGQSLIDRAGLEIGSIIDHFWQLRLKSDSDSIHPAMREFMDRVSSGEHQWEAIAGLQSGVIQAGIGGTLANLMFPVTGILNSADRNLILNAADAATAVVAGLADAAAGDSAAAAYGYTADAFKYMMLLAESIPGAAQILDARNRGLITLDQARYYLRRGQLPAELVDVVLAQGAALLSPADAALAVLRGNMSMQAGYDAAAESGVRPVDFDILIGNTGEPLALEEMLLLYRWQKMDKATLERGIKQSRIRDEWIPYAEQLGIVPPSGAEIIDALVRGQIKKDEAVKRWHVAGGDPTWFETAYTSSSNPPSPTQLAELANRQIIPWDGTGPNAISYQQGIYEGDTKDKWEPYFRQLAVYHPPPREVSTLVRESGMTQDEAESYWEQSGLPPGLAHRYWVAAHYQRTAAVHHLAQAQIVKLYADKAIDRAEALAMLESVNWTKTDAEWLLDIEDFRLAAAAVEGAISKIKGLFVAHKITATTVKAALASLDVPDSQAEQLLKTWQLERDANLKTLTAAQITDAWYYKLIDAPAAQAMLEADGYTAYDAWLILNIKNKGPIDNFPQPAGG